jgi:hypothetical protein
MTQPTPVSPSALTEALLFQLEVDAKGGYFPPEGAGPRVTLALLAAREQRDALRAVLGTLLAGVGADPRPTGDQVARAEWEHNFDWAVSAAQKVLEATEPTASTGSALDLRGSCDGAFEEEMPGAF